MPTLAALTELLHHPLLPRIAMYVVCGIVGAWYLFRPRLRPLGPDTRLAYLALRHPEPIASWARSAMSYQDQGNLLMDEDPAICREMLARDWSITDEASLRGQLVGLLHRRPLQAWSGIRAIRVALLGAGAGYVHEEWAWDIVRAAAVGLQDYYTSFEDTLSQYLESRRAWRSLPRDQEIERDAMGNLAAAQRHYRVSFRVDVASTKPAVLPPEAARYFR